MTGNEEAVLVETLVVAGLRIGSERLRLFFTDRRMIVAHIGKRGVGTPGLSSFFGRLSGAVEDIFKSGRESVSKRKLRSSTPREILATDKDNFAVDYADIVDLVFDLTFLHPRLTVVTRDDKFQFTVSGESEDLPEVLQRVLDGRVHLRMN